MNAIDTAFSVTGIGSNLTVNSVNLLNNKNTSTFIKANQNSNAQVSKSNFTENVNLRVSLRHYTFTLYITTYTVVGCWCWSKFYYVSFCFIWFGFVCVKLIIFAIYIFYLYLSHDKK